MARVHEFEGAIKLVEDLQMIIYRLQLMIPVLFIGIGVTLIAFYLNSITLYMLGMAILFGTGTAYIYKFWSISKTLLKRSTAFFVSSYTYWFETHKPTGKSPPEWVLRHLLGFFTEVGEGLKPYLKNRKRLDSLLNVEIEGKRSRHRFDVYVDGKLIKKKMGSIFVKRFEEEVDGKKLAEFKEEIVDVINKTKSRVHTMAVVSTTGFSKSALAFAKKKENRIKNRAFDLLKEEKKPEGYSVVRVSD
jgi:hypothetical protein